jgi:flagellar biosynthesis chaperone FliJ
MFFEPKTQIRRDVFLDFFELCHNFDFRKRLEVESFSIPIADLLMTKLQVVQIEERDYRDIVCILIDHEVTERDTNDAINKEYIAGMCSNDWGIYKTFTQNLEKTLGYLQKSDLKVAEKKPVQERINTLAEAIETVSKSSRWKMRSLVGERVSWYEAPEAPKAIKFAEE